MIGNSLLAVFVFILPSRYVKIEKKKMTAYETKVCVCNNNNLDLNEYVIT